MEKITRREFLTASGAILAALGFSSCGFVKPEDILLENNSTGVASKKGASSLPSVIWLQGQGCTGCSTSLLNTIYYATIDELLLNTLDLKFHPTVMAAAGDLAVSEGAYSSNGGYVLVVEGAIPTAEGGKYCYLWPGMTALDGVKAFSKNASFILAVGTCATYGGISAGAPNPTSAKGLSHILGTNAGVINIPGCPSHPDWVVGTIAHLLTYDEAPELDSKGRPRDFYQNTLHNQCPNRWKFHEKKLFAGELSELGCLHKLGCEGQSTAADCPIRKWNSAGNGEYGVNWCIGARNPCQGCTEPGFPDEMAPFYTLERKGKGKTTKFVGEQKIVTV